MKQKDKDDILNKFMPAFEKITSQSGMSQVMATGIYHITLAILKEVLNSIDTNEILEKDKESEEASSDITDIADILKPIAVPTISLAERLKLNKGESSEVS